MKPHDKTARWVWLLVALQAVFLLAWAAYHENIRQTAPTVKLRTVPVDPRDVIRGDYMVLNYEIGRTHSPEPGIGDGGEVYVVLRREGAYHAIDTVLAAEPPEADSRLWVRAQAYGAGDSLNLRYGIEEYFVPEGRGTPRFKTMDVEASVSADHRLYIRRVFLDGQRFP